MARFLLLKDVIHAFITRRSDFFNSLLSDISQRSLSCLRLILDSAARILTWTTKHDDITPILASLHRLLPQIVDFKILLITYEALVGLTPSYLTELLLAYILS